MDIKEKNEVLFINLVIMFHSLIWQQLGKVQDPVSGKVERNLEGARALIDTLEMLKTKTDGRRTENEDKALLESLKELRLNFVDESAKKATDGGSPSPEKEKGEES